MVIETEIRKTQDLADRIVKEMFVLALYYNGYKTTEISKILGVGTERVRQIKRKALARIKNAWGYYEAL